MITNLTIVMIVVATAIMIIIQMIITLMMIISLTIIATVAMIATLVIIVITTAETMMAPLDKVHILDVLLLLKWKTLCLEMKIK